MTWNWFFYFTSNSVQQLENKKNMSWRWRRLLALQMTLLSLLITTRSRLCPTTTKTLREEAWSCWPTTGFGLAQGRENLRLSPKREWSRPVWRRWQMSASRAHSTQSEWERGREVSEAEVWCQSGVRDKRGQAGAREGQGRDWSGKEKGLDKGLTQGTMLMFAWIVFLKGPLLLYIVLGGGYTGIYNFKIHWTKIIAFVVC